MRYPAGITETLSELVIRMQRTVISAERSERLDFPACCRPAQRLLHTKMQVIKVKFVGLFWHFSRLYHSLPAEPRKTAPS